MAKASADVMKAVKLVVEVAVGLMIFMVLG